MKVTVFTDRDSLLRELSEKCSNHEFVRLAGAVGTTVLIVDGSGGAPEPLRGAEIVRITLSGPRGAERATGELRIDADSFLASPEPYLSLAADLVDATLRLRCFEAEAEFDARIRRLLAATDLDSICGAISNDLIGHLGLQGGSIFFHDVAKEMFALAFSREAENAPEPELTHEVLESLHEHVGDPLPHLVCVDPSGVRRVALPILVKEDVIGVFLGSMGAKTELNGDDMVAATRYLRTVTMLLAQARQLSQNRDLVMRDDLTKAFNRRFFESYLDEEIERTRRYGSVFSIIFLDLDDLKAINNQFGHLTGSRVLQEVAKRILTAVRAIDKVVRFGGDEFCIILPETDKDQAMSVAMRVRRSMSSSPFEIEPAGEVQITASFGIATYPNHALSKENLVRQADDAMYRVKATTKNAIGVAGEFDVKRAGTASI
jgi:diguanylate cyclase (GGDEF)-like protein